MAVFHCDSVIGDENFLYQYLSFLSPINFWGGEGEKKKKRPLSTTQNLKPSAASKSGQGGCAALDPQTSLS